MKLSDEQRDEIKTEFIPYNGKNHTKAQRRILKRYGVSYREDRGKAHFLYEGRKVGVPVTKTHGRASQNVVSNLIKLLEDSWN
ncbi:hypothetical protein CMI46_03115 [Candidatus Pacearchaeota archaeon]|nr:hypothetical protein [Candidatus Pacearchaeota archaeon]|tara:strand:- start:771 stop:1019 length:249 start_codon:yes stop_codon:yes gene_type:complete